MLILRMLFRPALSACLAVGLLTGCAGGPEEDSPNSELGTVGSPTTEEADPEAPSGTGEWFATKKAFTPFFVLGPQQSGGPDLSLKKDEKVELVKRGFGYSQVKIEDGRIGYVATDSLEPSEPPAPEVEPEAPVSGAITRVYSSGSSSSSSPPPDLPPLPEPAPALQPEEVPAFRY